MCSPCFPYRGSGAPRAFTQYPGGIPRTHLVNADSTTHSSPNIRRNEHMMMKSPSVNLHASEGGLEKDVKTCAHDLSALDEYVQALRIPKQDSAVPEGNLTTEGEEVRYGFSRSSLCRLTTGNREHKRRMTSQAGSASPRLSSLLSSACTSSSERTISKTSTATLLKASSSGPASST